MGPFDYIKSINSGAHFKEPVDIADYSSYVIALNFSLFPDTVLQANEVNRLHDITPQMHYDYLRLTIRPRNRWKKWPKKDKVNAETIGLIKHMYKYNTIRAIEALSILTDAQIKWLQDQQSTGG